MERLKASSVPCGENRRPKGLRYGTGEDGTAEGLVRALQKKPQT
jgi:hypothetical protein